MKPYYLFLLLCLAVFELPAQTLCVTPTGEPNLNFTPILRMKNAIASNENTICLNIYFHVVRQSNGTGGLQPYDLNSIIDNLNSDFEAANIQFHLLGYENIDNTGYYSLEGSERDAIFYFNNQNNAINFYIVMTADGFNGYTEHIPGTNLVLTQSAAFTGVASHEIGHCLNLYHTHHGHSINEPPSPADTTACQEDTTQSNCVTCGDYLCDTPADPCLRDKNNSSNYFVDEYCTYLPNNGYHPDTHNFMSYSRPGCLDHFTNMQCIRMRDAVLNSSVLQPVISCACSPPNILGNEVIKTSDTELYTLPCNSGGITWSVSQNLTKISEQPGYILVQAVNSSVNGSAWVQAVTTGQAYYKEIWIGKPLVSITASPSGNYVELEIVGDHSNIVQQGITKILWQKNSGTGFLPVAPNEFENIAHGNGYSWFVEATVKIENKAGAIEKYITINAPTPPCGPEYIIEQIEEGIYQVINIIDPCDNMTLNSASNRLVVADSELVDARIVDLFSNTKKIFNKNKIDTRQLKSGVYLIKVILNKVTITKKIVIP